VVGERTDELGVLAEPAHLDLVERFQGREHGRHVGAGAGLKRPDGAARRGEPVPGRRVVLGLGSRILQVRCLVRVRPPVAGFAVPKGQQRLCVTPRLGLVVRLLARNGRARVQQRRQPRRRDVAVLFADAGHR
jgi:hypothetical protein